MKAFITGGAGFIGSNLAEKLIDLDCSVTVFDNLSTGFLENVRLSSRQKGLSFIEGDLLDAKALGEAMSNHDVVFHLAANADVRFGFQQPHKDLEQNTVATFNVLEAMRANSIAKIAFSSTGSVYGEPKIFPTPENAPFPVQTSLYAASKIAGEAMLQAYAAGYGFKVYIFRFVSLMGKRYSHGHVVDFYKQLITHPDTLHVLGNGLQTKSYLHVDDCIEAILLAMSKANDAVNIFNLGFDGTCTVRESIGWIEEILGTNASKNYSGGERGWIGDSPLIHLDTTRINSLGWQPSKTIEEAIKETAIWISQNEWILDNE